MRDDNLPIVDLKQYNTVIQSDGKEANVYQNKSHRRKTHRK